MNREYTITKFEMLSIILILYALYTCRRTTHVIERTSLNNVNLSVKVIESSIPNGDEP